MDKLAYSGVIDFKNFPGFEKFMYQDIKKWRENWGEMNFVLQLFHFENWLTQAISKSQLFAKQINFFYKIRNAQEAKLC